MNTLEDLLKGCVEREDYDPDGMEWRGVRQGIVRTLRNLYTTPHPTFDGLGRLWLRYGLAYVEKDTLFTHTIGVGLGALMWLAATARLHETLRAEHVVEEVFAASMRLREGWATLTAADLPDAEMLVQVMACGTHTPPSEREDLLRADSSLLQDLGDLPSFYRDRYLKEDSGLFDSRFFERAWAQYTGVKGAAMLHEIAVPPYVAYPHGLAAAMDEYFKEHASDEETIEARTQYVAARLYMGYWEKEEYEQATKKRGVNLIDIFQWSRGGDEGLAVHRLMKEKTAPYPLARVIVRASLFYSWGSSQPMWYNDYVEFSAVSTFRDVFEEKPLGARRRGAYVACVGGVFFVVANRHHVVGPFANFVHAMFQCMHLSLANDPYTGWVFPQNFGVEDLND